MKVRHTFCSDFWFVSEVDETSDMEHGLRNVMKDEQTESKSSKVHHISSCYSDQVDGGVRYTSRHIFTFYLLKVEFRVRVEPVSDLDDEEEFKHKRHRHVGVLTPYSRNVEEEAFT